MKQRLLFSLLMLVAATATMSAYDFEVDGIYYNINGDEVTVTSGQTYYESYSGDIIIPETVTNNGTTYEVTEIARKAFYSCTSLTSVVIPNTVRTIGNSAFSGCNKLCNVTIPASVTTIDEYAFYDCSSIDSVFISDITAWCTIQFGYAGNLLRYAKHLILNGEEVVDLVVPGSVSDIGENAFNGFKGLRSVAICDGVLSIGNDAFYDCTNITSLDLGNTVTTIGPYAFSKCSGLTHLSIPNSVATISFMAFEQCVNLASLHIPNSVSSIGRNAFAFCFHLSSIIVDSNNPVYDSRDNCNAIIETATNDLFVGCNNTVIPNTVTSIHESAFQSMIEMTEVFIPNSVTTIGELAFNGCTALTTINIPSSITLIDYYAFDGCTSLQSVHITDLESWCNTHFNSNPLKNAHHLILNGNEITDLVIPSTLTAIGKLTFQGCQGLTDVTIPNTVTTIGISAFNGCTGLTEMIIPNSITAIPQFMCDGCSGLQRVDLPQTITSIGSYAFRDCGSLTSIEIPNSVTRIYDYAFSKCQNMTSVICYALTPPTAGYFFSKDDTTLYQQSTLSVPAEALEAYRAHAEWGRFARILPFIGAGPGDIDGDGSIDVSDVTTIIGMILDTQEIPAYADVDGDGVVDVGDVTLLINRILNQH